MRTAARAGLALGAWLLACQGPEVDHVGSYAFLPNAPVADTDPWPLEHFLVIEQDGVSGETLFYYFEGTLGAAGIGLEGLERLAAYYGSFRLRFEYPLARYTSPPAQAGAGGEGGADAVAGAGGAENEWSAGLGPDALESALELRVGQHRVPLVLLDDADLSQLGATRFLSSLSGSQWSIAAYFGVLRSVDELGNIELSSGAGLLRYEPDLGEPSVFEVTREASGLELMHEPAGPVDTVELDLLQTLTRVEDQASVEAILRGWSEPGAGVSYEQELLQNAFDANCWSSERTLYARLRQIVREYTTRASGDFAVEHSRASTLSLDADEWQSLIDESGHPAYCEGYR